MDDRRYGSLPNLHELSSRQINFPIQNELLARKIKNFEYLRSNKRSETHHQHQPICHTRSFGSNPHEIKRKLSTDKNSKITRSLRSSSVIPIQFHNIGVADGRHKRCSVSRQASTSSTGTNSVRKLIGVVKLTPSQLGPVYSRQNIWQNFIALCLVHGMFTVAYMPVVILQSSISSWWWPVAAAKAPTTAPHEKITITSGIGSLLCSGLFLVAAGSSILSPFISYKISVTRYLSISYAASTAFMSIHLYPKLYLLIPSYVVMGIAIANINYTRTAYMIILASKLKFVLNDREENELRYKSDNARKETLVIKLFGWLALSKNIGLAFGGVLTYFLIQITTSTTTNSGADANSQNGKSNETTFSVRSIRQNNYDYQLCGYNRCPLQFLFPSTVDNSELMNATSLTLPCKTSTMLAAVFTGCGMVATAVSFAIIHRNRVRFQYSPVQRLKFLNILHTTYATFKYKKLQLMIPLMLFIGAEQGFMYADFIKLYVTCVTGVQTTPLIFISLGLLQSFAAVTLCLLLSHFKRYYIVVVGFMFQACLLLSLIMWKPKTDDIGLFYVISSAWGVCNAIWETLSFCLLLALFPDNWEFPFAHNDFFRHLGLSIAFVYHEHLCISIKLYVISFMLLLSVIPYAWLESKLNSQHESGRHEDSR